MEVDEERCELTILDGVSLLLFITVILFIGLFSAMLTDA